MKSANWTYAKAGKWIKGALPVGFFIILVSCIIVFYKIGTPTGDMDGRLCPVRGPIGATILLLDTSDPLTPKHKAELERLARQIVANHDNEIGIAPGELLAVHELTQEPGEPRQLLEICRPPIDPKKSNWLDEIHRGKRFTERDWEKFEEALAMGFPKTDNPSNSQPTSPLLETIAVLAARYVPGKRGDKGFEVHLIVFSDLLQHSESLSHYGFYPPANHMPRDLLTDLTNVKVSLFRLERQKYAKWQTENHYYWWTELVLEQGGEIEWQESI